MSSLDGSTGSVNPAARGRRKGSPFLLLAAGLLFFAAAVGVAYMMLRPTTLRIAVGPAGSDDLQLAQAMAQTFAAEGASVRLSVIATEGPVDSLAALAAGKADLAVGRADEEMPEGTSSVAIMRKNVVVLWAPAGAPRKPPKKDARARIKAIEDLAGRRVGVVGRTKVNTALLRVILKESGVDPDKVQVTQFGTDQISQMVRDQSIDAFMMVGPSDGKPLVEAITATARQRGEPAFLPVEVSEAIAARHPLYESEEVPGSAFTTSPARPDDTLETVSIYHLLVAPKSLSETAVGTLTRQIFAAKPDLARQVPAASKIEKPDTDKDAALPAHPGAAAFIDGTERSFMDKYSDYIWGVVLLFSVLGSVTAAVRHFIKRDERKASILHRERLIAAIAHARRIETIQELDALQREADDILRETLDCYEDGAIDESDLAAYGLVLDQFHHAVADRRAALGTPVTIERMKAAE